MMVLKDFTPIQAAVLFSRVKGILSAQCEGGIRHGKRGAMEMRGCSKVGLRDIEFAANVFPM
jgi:hypothetical protein